MSFLVIEVLSKGIVFAADRNITSTLVDGSEHQDIKRAKVLKWPNDIAIIGYVGIATIDGLPMDEWLTNFMNDNLSFQSLADISEKLRSTIEKQRGLDERDQSPEALLIHLGGFEMDGLVKIPKIYLITNVWGLENGQYCDIRKQFKSTEELTPKFKGLSTKNYQKFFESMETKLDPFWFHQGFDLITFNVMHSYTKQAFKFLIEKHPSHSIPKSLEEWEKHIKMQILMYGAYFEAFGSQGQQYVGGGVDIVSIKW